MDSLFFCESLDEIVAMPFFIQGNMVLPMMYKSEHFPLLDLCSPSADLRYLYPEKVDNSSLELNQCKIYIVW